MRTGSPSKPRRPANDGAKPGIESSAGFQNHRDHPALRTRREGSPGRDRLGRIHAVAPMRCANRSSAEQSRRPPTKGARPRRQRGLKWGDAHDLPRAAEATTRAGSRGGAPSGSSTAIFGAHRRRQRRGRTATVAIGAVGAGGGGTDETSASPGSRGAPAYRPPRPRHPVGLHAQEQTTPRAPRRRTPSAAVQPVLRP